MFDLGLDNKVVLITGGSDGLGRATAERFALEGAKVVICARRSEHLFQVANEIGSDCPFFLENKKKMDSRRYRNVLKKITWFRS